MSLRTAFQAVAEADAVIPTLVGMNTGGVKSILPKAGLTIPPFPLRPGVKLPPLPARPILALYMGASNLQDVFIFVQTATWAVLDDPGEQYHRIDRIIGELKRAYPYGSEQEYLDYGGVAFHQELVLESQDAVEDVSGLTLRWLDYALWRA